MEIKVPAALWLVGAVDADNVVLLVFNPDATDEMRTFDLLVGHHVEHERPDVAQKLLSLIFEVIVVLIEAVAQEDKLHEALRQIIHFVEAVQSVEHAREHADLLLLIHLVVDAVFVEHQPAKKVLVAHRHFSKLIVLLGVLNVSLHQGCVFVHGFDELCFAVEDAVGNDIHLRARTVRLRNARLRGSEGK